MNSPSSQSIHQRRLFWASCISLISTSVAFGAVTSMMGDFKNVFALSGVQAGQIGGAALWGFTISIFVFGPLVDSLGMKRLMIFACACHLLGPLMMIFAPGFNLLFAGALVIALGNGTVEAVCNPLVATLFPNDKTHKLNQFHVWFPGGIVIGGLLSYFIDRLGTDFWAALPLAAWQAKIALVLIPTVIYGILVLPERFPKTERVQSGLSFGDMVRATFLNPFFILLFICMGLTASLELGPGRWMAEAMQGVMSQFAGENAGILVLVYGSGLMAVLRYFAGPVVHRLSPTGMLVMSAILAGIGLFSMTMVSGAITIFICATIFYVGVCYFWPTMLGVAAERVPRGGALALALLGGWGMAVVGLVTVPVMGAISDHAGHAMLPEEETRVVLMEGITALEQAALAADAEMVARIQAAEQEVQRIMDLAENGELPPGETTTALREIQVYAPDSPAGQRAAELIVPADDFGGLVSFRVISGLSIILIVVFGSLYIHDRMRGGYRIEKIVDESA